MVQRFGKHRIDSLLPGAVTRDELGALEAAGMHGVVLEPQEMERHTLAALLLVNDCPVRTGRPRLGSDLEPHVW